MMKLTLVVALLAALPSAANGMIYPCHEQAKEVAGAMQDPMKMVTVLAKLDQSGACATCIKENPTAIQEKCLGANPMLRGLPGGGGGRPQPMMMAQGAGGAEGGPMPMMMAQGAGGAQGAMTEMMGMLNQSEQQQMQGMVTQLMGGLQKGMKVPSVLPISTASTRPLP